MKILQVGSMPDGTEIQLEDWNEDYRFMPPGSTLAAYPISQINMDGQFAPKRNQSFRISFNFDNEQQARQAYEDLIVGTKQLIDFKEAVKDRELIECL